MYEKECAFLQTTAKNALKKYMTIQKSTRAKAEYDVVTDVDMSVEAYVIDEIHKNFPKDTILSEENNPKNGFSKRTWVLDPIDGTWNFMGGSPLFGFQGAFCVDGRPVVSVIILPILHEEYYAIKGGGAYRNGKKLQVQAKDNLHQTIVSFADFNHDQPVEKQPAFAMLQRIYPKIGRLRAFGASCIDFTGIASGKIDGSLLVTRNLWDVLPGALLCKEAGALLCDLGGRKYHNGAEGIIVTISPKLQSVIVASAGQKNTTPRRRLGVRNVKKDQKQGEK